jgi:hypothetical protein
VLTLSLSLFALAKGDEPDVHRFDIDAQSLSSALNQFAQQSQQPILFAPDLVAQKYSTPLHGNLERLSALKRLLNGSGLTFTTTTAGTILVGNPAERSVKSATARPNDPNSGDSESDLATITVHGERQRDLVRQQIMSYVAAIAPPPGEALGRWERWTPLCPLIAGLPDAESEYLLKKVSQIAVESGAPLASEHCKANAYFVFSSHPDALIKAWSHRDPWMFDDNLPQGGTVIHRFLHAKTTARAWYNVVYTRHDGLPMAMMSETAHAWGLLAHDLWSVIVIIDAGRAQDISYGQLAAYIAMVGLSQIRLNAKLDDALSILQLFADPAKAPRLGLSAWDKAYLKALYNTTPSDISQRLEITRSMVQAIAP